MPFNMPKVARNRRDIMTRRRVLRPWVQTTLMTVEVLLLVCVGSLDDITMQGVSVVLGMLFLMGLIAMVLNKYGR